MLGYTTIGVSDIDKAEEFYSKLLADIGAKKLLDAGRIRFFGTSPKAAMLAICLPFDEQTHSCGNGSMIAIPGGDRSGVDKLYKKAIELGAADDGEPGERLPIFYGAYVRDPDGNKLCFYDMQMD